jgi:hypothetical protein
VEEPCEAIVGPEPLDGLIDALQQAIRTLVAERQAFIGRHLDPSSRGVAPCAEPRPLAA